MGIQSAPPDAIDIDVDALGDFDLATLEKLVLSSQVENTPIAARKYSVHRVLELDGQHFKVRAFRNPTAAQRQLNLIRRIRRLFPKCYGRIGRCLIWDYVPAISLPHEPQVMVDIGRFLAEIAQAEVTPISEDLFVHWCREIERAGIFLPRSINPIISYFANHRLQVPSWNLEYVDALPKNFIYGPDGKFLCIDGKHIFPGPRGLGLIKLHCHVGYLISNDDYLTVVKSYRDRVKFPEYDDPEYFNFLLFYYCMVLLADNAQFISRRCNMESARTRWRKRVILKTVRAPLSISLVERARSDFFYFASRLRGRVARFWNSDSEPQMDR